jgi:hypothetical protein
MDRGYQPFEGGFDIRRGEFDVIVGHETVQEASGSVRVISHRYNDTGMVTDQRTYTPDEAIELAGALEAAANAVWERVNESNEETD